MTILLDRQSDLPLYLQIEAYFRQSILSGLLEPETRLPASRKLARELGVNRITVETAYAELEVDGLVISRVGSGTYVLSTAALAPLPEYNPNEPWPLWQQELQDRFAFGSRVTPEAMLKKSGHPDPISFAGGVGDSRTFPAEDFRKVIQMIMRRDGVSALEYGEHNGYSPLRSTIAHILSSQGLQTRAENILVTAGSQQALALVLQILLRPGDALVIESPTYATALDLFHTLGLHVIGVPTDRHGMQVEKLEILLQKHHPRLIYTIPNFQNPTGTVLSLPRRRQLLALAERYNIPILEDDYVGDLRYEGSALPSLKALDPGGRVIYLSTFSKMLMPGLRVGFLVADGPVYDTLVTFKRASDLTTSNLIQRALEAYVTVGRYQTHLHRSCLLYRKRRDAMLAAIHHYMPEGVQVTPPQGGLFIWLRLPGNLNADKLLPLACEEGVAFAPGSRFYLDGTEGVNCMRLNFVMHSPERIEEGMQRLGKAIQRAISESGGVVG